MVGRTQSRTVSSHCSCQIVFLILCKIVSCTPQVINAHTSSMWCKKKKILIRLSYLFIALWSISDAHMFILGSLSCGIGSVWVSCLDLLHIGQPCSPICNKVWSTVYSDTFYWIGPHKPASAPHMHKSWLSITLKTVDQCFFLGPHLIETDRDCTNYFTIICISVSAMST